LKWSPINDLDLRLSYVRGFRAPSLKELYLYFVDINHDVRGNPELKAENSHNMNVSLIYDKNQHSNFYGIEFNSFNNIINSKIDLINDTANIYSYANISEFRSLGYNLKLKYKLHPRLFLLMGVSRTGTFSSISELKLELKNYTFSTDYAAEFRYDLFQYGMNLSVFYKFNLLIRFSYWIYLLTTLVTTFTCAFGGASIRAVESAPGIDPTVVKTHAWTGMGVFLLTVLLAYTSIRAIRKKEGKYKPDTILLILSLGFLITFTITTLSAFRIR
jgi:hypothetical protein